MSAAALPAATHVSLVACMHWLSAAKTVPSAHAVVHDARSAPVHTRRSAPLAMNALRPSNVNSVHDRSCTCRNSHAAACSR